MGALHGAASTHSSCDERTAPPQPSAPWPSRRRGERLRRIIDLGKTDGLVRVGDYDGPAGDTGRSISNETCYACLDAPMATEGLATLLLASLDHVIGVRIPASQSNQFLFNAGTYGTAPSQAVDPSLNHVIDHVFGLCERWTGRALFGFLDSCQSTRSSRWPRRFLTPTPAA